MDKQRKFQAPMVGGSSLLVIFAVLCLTVFALLGFSTVQADRRLADASIAAVSAYYAADCEAEKIFAQLRAGQDVQGVQEDGGVYSYACPISETQMLLVQVQREEDGGWQVLSWQSVSTAQWSDEQYINVWSGDIDMDSEDKGER